MKILFMSDIHGITKNLSCIEELDNKETFDKIVVLGDLYYSGPSFDNSEKTESKKVLEFLMKYEQRLIAIRGNCDSDVDVKVSDFPISNLSLICVDGLDIYCTHGNEYNREETRKFKRKGILIYGHEHYPYIHKEDDMIYINSGSISLPKNNSNPSYVIYENKEFTIYDILGNIVDKINLD